MEEKEFKNQVESIYRVVMMTTAMLGAVLLIIGYVLTHPEVLGGNEAKEYQAIAEVEAVDLDRVENGIHVSTGFVAKEGYMKVVQNCTNCHSSKLVTQNRMSRERWIATIKWMQETQNLWDLGKNEKIIVDYLAKYYAPDKKGRRENLNCNDWYELELK